MSTVELRERIVRYLERRYGVIDPNVKLNSQGIVKLYHAFGNYHINGEKNTLIEIGGSNVEIGSVLAMHNWDVEKTLMDIVISTYKIDKKVFPYVDKDLHPIFFEGKSLEESGIPPEPRPEPLSPYDHNDSQGFGGKPKE